MYNFIINPASSSGRGGRIWQKLLQPYLEQHKIDYTFFISQEPGHVAILAKNFSRTINIKKNNTLIIVGGDGTMNEALQGLTNLEHIALGYIPAGSSNDLARNLKLPKNPIQALEAILYTKTPTAMDMGVVTFSDGTSRRFAVSCGIGFDAAVCHYANTSKLKKALNKVKLGKLVYLGIALKQIIATKAISCKISIDQQQTISIGKILFVASMIHRYEGGGFQFCPTANCKDGILNICTVGDLKKAVIFLALPTAFLGKHFIIPGINPYTSRQIHIETSSPLWVHTDGEVIQKTNQISITCLQNAITIFC